VIAPHAMQTNRIIAGAAAAYFAHRLWSGWGDGVIYGDGDNDVQADKHPIAFVLTALSVVTVLAILAMFALGSSLGELAALAMWLWRLLSSVKLTPQSLQSAWPAESSIKHHRALPVAHHDSYSRPNEFAFLRCQLSQ
jgi:hypothetical protein